MSKRYIVEEVSSGNNIDAFIGFGFLFFVGMFISWVGTVLKWLTVNFFIPYKSYLPLIGLGFLALIAFSIYGWVSYLSDVDEDEEEDDS